MEPEYWKDIEGFEGYYQVSNRGRVRSLSRVTLVCGVKRPGKPPRDEYWHRQGKILTPIHFNGSRQYYRLYKEGQPRKLVSISSLLKQYFSAPLYRQGAYMVFIGTESL